MDYSEKLKDPRWQKKRLRILERDGWKCKGCSSSDKTLHVHHLFYFKVKEPWEIPNGFLFTLCEDCHKCIGDEAGFTTDGMVDEIGLLLNSIWASGYDLYDLQDISMAIAKIQRPIGPVIDFEITVKPHKFEK